MKGMGDVSLMERLLNSDTIHQQKLSKVVRLLRDEFAFDGYMENGIEDLAMGRLEAGIATYRCSFCCIWIDEFRMNESEL